MKRPPKILLNNAARPWTHATAQGALARSTISQPHMRLVGLIALSVFVCEALLMFILSYLPALPTGLQALIDATLLVFLLSPVLYFGLFRTLGQYINERLRAEEIIKKQRDSLDQQVPAAPAWACM